MSNRANDCVSDWHMHVGQCQRAGYANGREDALDEVAALVAAGTSLEDAISQARGQ